MSYSLNSLDGDYIRDYIGAVIRVLKGDTRSFDNGSYEVIVWDAYQLPVAHSWHSSHVPAQELALAGQRLRGFCRPERSWDSIIQF